jgi:TRAP-type C4-dicarboxylate transport system permease small subunit
MKSWTKIEYIIQKTNETVCSIGMYVLVPMMFLTSIDVICRAFWSHPITGSIEMSEYMLVILIMLGLGYTEKQKGNVRVDFIAKKLPKKVLSIIDIITSILSMTIIIIVIWQGWLLAMKETTVSYMLRIPQTPFRLMVSIGCFLLFLEMTVNLAKACNNFFRRSDD